LEAFKKFSEGLREFLEWLEKLLECSEKFLEAFKKLFGRLGKLPEPLKKFVEPFQEFLGRFKKFSEWFKKLPERFRQLSERFGQLSGRSRHCSDPAVSENFPPLRHAGAGLPGANKKIGVAFFLMFRIIRLQKNMKHILLSLVVCMGFATPLLADGTNLLSDEKAKASYAIGMTIGHNFQQQGLDIDLDLVLRGMKDMQPGGAPLMTIPEMQSTLKAFQQEVAAKQMEKRKELEAKNKADGDAFLATNKNNAGVVTLPDGLQYQVITAGTGAVPSPTDTVTVNYRGTLLDGTEFDSSYKRGKPASFPVNGVIPGWTEALEKMPVGSKWKLFIPSDLAYGERGNMGIAPNSTLIFEVELLDTKASPPPVASQPLSSDIIKVPSAEEMKNGAKIETIKAEDVAKMQTNSAAK
jgi:FKBP-type peptidyl-prolyl cis-trans isomerase FklB